MRTIKIRAVKPLSYGGRPVAPGAEFSASPRDAKLLVAIKRAAYVLEAKPEPAPAPQPAAVAVPEVEVTIRAEDEPQPRAELLPADPPADAPAAEPAAEPVKPRRQYRRRDMAAGD